MNKLNKVLLNIAFAVNVLLVFVLLFEQRIQELSPFMQVLGRLHPMVLHFPVALLFLLLVMEAFFYFNRHLSPHLEELNRLFIALTAVSSGGVALMGFLLSHNGGYEGSDMWWHKWTGVSVAFLAGILAWLRSVSRLSYRIGLMISVVTVSVAGHYGASLTHGSDFVTAPLRSKTHKVENIDSAVVFKDLIQPVLETKCVGCHNPNKIKGELLLTDKENIMKGGEGGLVLVPGSPDSSRLYSYLLLPMDDDKHMPPDGKVQLELEEIKLIHWWIAAGADFERKFSQGEHPDSIQAIVKALYAPLSPLDKLNIDFVAADKIAALNNPKRGVRQVSAGKPYLDVYLANREDISPTALAELDAIREQVVSLNLSNTNTNDELLKEVAKFPHLQRLYLENTTVTDAGVNLLTDLKFLEYLNLSGTQVSRNVTPSLKKIPALNRVYVYQTAIAAADLPDLRKDLPGIGIGFVALLNDSIYHAKLRAPEVDIDSMIFSGRSTITIDGRMKGTKVHYTTDGSLPTAAASVYTGPLTIDSTATLRVMASLEGWEESPVSDYSLLHSAFRPLNATLAALPDSQYLGRKDTTLFDLVAGSTTHTDGKYLGYKEDDFQVLVDLGANRTISGANVSYLVNMGSGIMPPRGMEVWAGEQETRLSKLDEVKLVVADSMVRGAKRHLLQAGFTPVSVRYIKIKVKNTGKLPPWHSKKGAQAWLFIDEVAFE